MSDNYIRNKICPKLNQFGTTETATNTVYRKFINFDGESRWTLARSLFEALQHSADFINSTVPEKQRVVLDSLPVTYTQTVKRETVNEFSLETDPTKPLPPSSSGSAGTAAPHEKKGQNSNAVKTSKNTLSGDAAIVAKNAARVLSMQALLEALSNVKPAIAQFMVKDRYKTDPEFVAILFSLLNSATRLASCIATYLSEMHVTN